MTLESIHPKIHVGLAKRYPNDITDIQKVLLRALLLNTDDEPIKGGGGGGGLLYDIIRDGPIIQVLM